MRAQRRYLAEGKSLWDHPHRQGLVLYPGYLILCCSNIYWLLSIQFIHIHAHVYFHVLCYVLRLKCSVGDKLIFFLQMVRRCFQIWYFNTKLDSENLKIQVPKINVQHQAHNNQKLKRPKNSQEQLIQTTTKFRQKLPKHQNKKRGKRKKATNQNQKRDFGLLPSSSFLYFCFGGFCPKKRRKGFWLVAFLLFPIFLFWWFGGFCPNKRRKGFWLVTFFFFPIFLFWCFGGFCPNLVVVWIN